jgi:hypothetical protein
MALSTARRAELLASLIATIRAQGSDRDIRAAVVSVSSRWKVSGDPSDAFVVFNLGQSAARLIDSGAALDASQTPSQPVAKLPTDRTIRDTDPRYQYRVVVRITSPEGNVRETLVRVRDDSVLSPDEIKRRAIEALQQRQPGASPKSRRAEIEPGAIFDTWIVTAGQMGR